MSLALALAFAAAFWLPAARVGRGYFPAPLDDVYIHFDFARALGQGHPFEWIAGQGYSSGETSPLYAVVLALGWLLGFRGRGLGAWAACVAVLSVSSLLRSTRRLVHPSPSWMAWLFALVPLSIGVVDWALFSGMEVALFAACLGRVLVALDQARGPAHLRAITSESAQWRLGVWGGALVLIRPEAVVIIAVVSVIAARGAGRRSGLLAALRVALPGAIATLLILGANYVFTGDARSAGAQLKLLSSNPFLSDEDRARVFVENLITFWVKVVRGEVAARPMLAIGLPLLATLGVIRRERRAVTVACVSSALAWSLLVSWNGNAPHHNFRYYAPGIILITVAASLGLAALTSWVRRRRWVGAIAGLFAIASGAFKIPGQVRHFQTSSANIRDQHVEVGERIATMPEGTRVLLGDAGAIPYVSNRSAVDALGLGGFHRIPFAHAAVHGEPAIVELIERLPVTERPTHLALYPNWFATITSRFGVEIDRVTIQDNLICGGPTKAIYRADWSSLDTPASAGANANEIDSLDVGDVIDEAAHSYVAPLPHGGYTTLDVLVDPATTARRFDGGRVIPFGARESFVVSRGAPGALVLRARIDAGARGIVLLRDGRPERELALEPPEPGRWRAASVSLEDGVRAGETLTLEARASAYSSYHVWITRAL